MTWFKTNSASVSNGGTVVTIGDGANTAAVKSGDALIIGSFQPVEVKAVFSGQIELVEAWGNSTQSGISATAMPTSGDFKSATEALRNATKITQDNYKVIQDWGKEVGTVTFVDYEGNEYEVKTMQEMENQHDAQISQQESDYNDRLANLLSLNTFFRTESDMEAMRAQNNDKFAASGFVHMGKSFASGTSVNEGLWTYVAETWENSLQLGRTNSKEGRSKTDHSVLNIAGFQTDLLMRSLSSSSADSRIKFPEAPDGTVTYDSSTGTVFDYSKEVDPKYGDVAADHNEAVARAFEGLVANGDFRLGTTHYLPQTNITLSVNNGVALVQNTSSGSGLNWITTDGDVQPSTKYRVEVFVDEMPASGNLAVQLGGKAYGNAEQYLSLGLNVLEVETTAATIVDDAIYFGYIPVGTQARVSSISVRPVTDEVVTDRVDMWGFEGWLEQITATNPYVYDRGLIQSQATDIDGVTTGDSNRPDSYYAVYDGDTTSRGKGVDFLALSVIEQDAIANNPKNHIYRMKNGDICSWRVRQRTIAGAGNGDWHRIDSTDYANDYVYLQFGTDALVRGQGSQNWTPPYSDNSSSFHSMQGYRTQHPSWSKNSGNNAKGLFVGGDAFPAYDNTGYFLVCGTVPRLNQGAYHPVYNPSGCSRFEGTAGIGRNWYHSEAIDLNVSTKAHCFSMISVNSSGAPNSGDISSGESGREDGRYYDAIYADGLGGVIDTRLPVWDASSAEKAAEIDAQVKAGTYRGMEKLTQTKIYDGDWWDSGHTNCAKKWLRTSGTFYVYMNYADYGIKVGDTVKLYADDGTLISVPVVTLNSGTYISAPANRVSVIAGPSDGSGEVLANTWMIAETKTNISVSGEFTQTDVVGDPANILLTPQLKDGWLGGWIPKLPTGASEAFPITRKLLKSASGTGNAINRTYTEDFGATWSVQTHAADGVSNTFTTSVHSANGVGVYSYIAFAKQTVEAVNYAVQHGEAGLGKVRPMGYCAPEWGGLTIESLLGKVCVSASSNGAGSEHAVLQSTIRSNGVIYTAANGINHTPLVFPAVENNSPAVKAMRYQVNVNQQETLQYAWNELVYTTDWGDDGALRIADGVSTYTNSNGDTCLMGTARLALPYGWIKNEH